MRYKGLVVVMFKRMFDASLYFRFQCSMGRLAAHLG